MKYKNTSVGIPLRSNDGGNRILSTLETPIMARPDFFIESKALRRPTFDLAPGPLFIIQQDFLPHNLKAVRFGFRMVKSFRNLTGVSAVMTRRLSIFDNIISTFNLVPSRLHTSVSLMNKRSMVHDIQGITKKRKLPLYKSRNPVKNTKRFYQC